MKKLLLFIPIALILAGLSGCVGENEMTHITTLEQLQAMKDNLSEDYILDNDIDASATSGWNEGAGFEPVGSTLNKFTGSFDGGNHTISDLYINRPSDDRIGLFGYINTVKEIKNVTLNNCDITGWYTVGSLTGYVGWEKPQISGITVSGDLVASHAIGGLIGSCTSAIRVFDCHTNVTITTSGTGDHVYIGGLIGDAGDDYDIEQCSAIVNIIIGDATDDEHADIGWIGGLFGVVGADCVVKKSFAKGTIVTGNANDNIYCMGGFAAVFGSNPIISDCYAQVDISVGNAGSTLDLMGGFTSTSRGTISRCYSTGSITYGTFASGTSYIGGFTGYDDGGTCSNCFWDTESSGMSESASGTGKTTAEMKTKSTFTDAGWDFNLVWDICPSGTPPYPWLQWEDVECGGAIIALIG